MNDNVIVQELLSAVSQRDGVGSLENLRLALNESEFANDAQARRLVALAHVASFSRDTREVNFAIDTFSELGGEAELANIIRLSEVYKVIRPAMRILDMREEERYPSWMRNAAAWFDLYHDSHHGVYFVPEEEVCLLNLFAKDDPSFWRDMIVTPGISKVRRELLGLLSRGEDPIVPMVEKRDSVEAMFYAYCREHGKVVIQRLQEGTFRRDKCSYVYLVLDNDGIFKVYKEMLDYTDRVVCEPEGSLYRRLSVESFLPRCYGDSDGVVNVGEHKFLRLSVHYGQSLADYTTPTNLLAQDEARFVASEVAEKLVRLLDKRILYLDLKPENILVERDSVKLLDLGIAKTLEPGQDGVDIFLADLRYVTPEGALIFQATEKSLVFQLGILFSQLLTGRHPFCVAQEMDERERESSLLKYSWPNAVCSPNLDGVSDGIVAEMLEKDPDMRPSLTEVKDALSTSTTVSIRHTMRERRQKEKNTILWVGRMGIPHKGHIEYIARFLEMGFYVKVAISRAYTITEKDPLPKWIVAKMVAQSLFARGFTTDDFEIMLTPFYDTDEGMKMHFLMMPERENIIAVASSNPGVWDLFPDKPILDQRSVFGVEDEEYDDLSWGESLRRAVREDDYATFRSYAADGIETILPFAGIQDCYGKPEIEFVSGRTIVILKNSEGKVIVRGNVLKYGTPEESLVFYLKRRGRAVELRDKFSSRPELVLDDCQFELRYEETLLQGEDEIIVFGLKKLC